jgi:hypothetical protein
MNIKTSASYRVTLYAPKWITPLHSCLICSLLLQGCFLEFCWERNLHLLCMCPSYVFDILIVVCGTFIFVIFYACFVVVESSLPSYSNFFYVCIRMKARNGKNGTLINSFIHSFIHSFIGLSVSTYCKSKMRVLILECCMEECSHFQHYLMYSAMCNNSE